MSESKEQVITPILEQSSPERTALNVPAFFHALLFAYQKKLVEVLGSGEAIFVHPVLDTISKIDKEKGLSTIRGNSIDEVLSNFAKDLLASQVVQKAWFEKKGESYIFQIEGCSFATHTHDLLKPKDVVCPLALVAMSVYQSKTGKKVQLTQTEFTSDGARTLITAKNPPRKVVDTTRILIRRLKETS
jgi:hypothetical protein